MASISVNVSSLPFVNVTNRLVPCEGPIIMPVALDFSLAGAVSYVINIQNVTDLGRMSMIQAVFLDNRNSAAPLTVFNPITQQLVSVGAGRQAYHNVLCPNPGTLIFASTGGVKITVQLMNFPVADFDWSAT